MDDLERRTLENEKNIALVAQRIDIHERECMEKHEAVLKQMRLTDSKIDRFISGYNKWMIGILTTIIFGILSAMFK